MNAHDVDQDEDDGKGAHTPFMQFYTSDWTAGTIGFTLEQRGFYFEALKTMWEMKSGLPDDTKWLGLALRCDPRTARKIRSFLLNKGKLNVKDNLLVNPRMTRDIAKWKRKQAAKIGKSSAEDQQTLALIFPENPTNSRPPPQTAKTSSSESNPDREDRSFKPVVIDGGQLRPAQVPRFVSEDALNQVRRLAPNWDRQFLLKKFLDWPGSKNAIDMDRAFLGWVRKFTKGKDAAHG